MKNTKKRKLVAFLIYAWVIGAIYFFIAWGTRLGMSMHQIDFIAILGVIIGLAETFALRFLWLRRFYPAHYARYESLSLIGKILIHLGTVLSAVFILILQVYLYSVINTGLISLFNLKPDAVPFPGEPITFALMFSGIRFLLIKLKDLAVHNIERIKHHVA